MELWQVSAEELLAAGEVGILPWVPLTRFEGPPRDILQRCRDRIDREASQSQRRSLLAVSQVLTRLRFSDPELLTLFGGRQIMIESPLIDELIAENTQNNILTTLEARFGQISETVSARLKSVMKKDTLQELVAFAARCPDLAAFEARLPVERPRPASTRKTPKRRKPSTE